MARLTLMPPPGTAGTAADKHDEQQHAPGELWPQGEIRSSIAGGGYDGRDLEKGIEEGFGAIDGRYIPGDQQYRCGDDAKIPAQLLVFKKVLYLAQQQEKVQVKVHAEQDHENSDDHVHIGAIIPANAGF